jgi:hypothetical protein
LTGKLNDFGALLGEAWIQKKRMSPYISNERIDELYDIALHNGALGGKITGAGGSGTSASAKGRSSRRYRRARRRGSRISRCAHSKLAGQSFEIHHTDSTSRLAIDSSNPTPSRHRRSRHCGHGGLHRTRSKHWQACGDAGFAGWAASRQ